LIHVLKSDAGLHHTAKMDNALLADALWSDADKDTNAREIDVFLSQGCAVCKFVLPATFAWRINVHWPKNSQQNAQPKESNATTEDPTKRPAQPFIALWPQV
jgi:hypothetical protein